MCLLSISIYISQDSPEKQEIGNKELAHAIIEADKSQIYRADVPIQGVRAGEFSLLTQERVGLFVLFRP